MDDAFAVTRCQSTEAKTAMVILRTVTIMKNFIGFMNKNFAKIKELKQQHNSVHFTKTKANLEIPLDEIQLLIQAGLVNDNINACEDNGFERINSPASSRTHFLF